MKRECALSPRIAHRFVETSMFGCSVTDWQGKSSTPIGVGNCLEREDYEIAGGESDHKYHKTE